MSKNAFSILKSIPKLKYTNYGHIPNVSAEEPVRYALLIGSPIAMLDLDNIEKDISKMTKNMIGHEKGIRKELMKLATNIRKKNTHINRVKKRLFVSMNFEMILIPMPVITLTIVLCSTHYLFFL